MSAQITFDYRTNRDLFSNHYLDDHLPDTEEWNDVSEDELRDAYDRIHSLWEREQDTAPQRNESQLEEKFIRPMFRELGIPFEVEESVDRGARRPDYGFFESEDAARTAFQRREEGDDFYENAVAVADAKRWGRALDTRGERERDFENPSYQIHVYLQETPTQWAVLTNGKKWRLYYGPTSHRLDSYYEIDLPTVLEQGNLEEFKYFYLFFRQEAFLPDASGDSFLDDVYDESNIFAQELGEDLQDNIYEAIKVLSEGFLQYPDNDLGAEALDDADLLPDTRSSFEEARLDLVHDASLIYLYRLIFVLYAESEGRDLLNTDNEIYRESYSLNSLKQDVAEERDSADPSYRDWQDNLWSRLDELFTLIDQGSKSKGIPKDDLYIPAYNGGLFRTDPEEDDSREARFLARYEAGDEHLAEVIDLLTRSENANGGGKIFVDYSSLDIRHLGSIYEGLLEYDLNVAGEPLTLDDGEYVSADVGDDVAVETGDVYLTTDSGERKATGSYYTPEYVVEYIVEETLGPLVDDIYQDLLASDPWGQEGGGAFAEDFAERVFDLKILDPAMGSGHFLTSAVDYLARGIINAQERQAEQQGVESIDQSHDINWARRQVAQRCIYGVDLNPLAVELAKVSLWLRTLAAEQPLAFLDHHLKTGNSLVGSDIEEVLGNGESETEGGQLTLQQSFARTRQQALEHVMDRFQDLLSIDNESLADIKEMEAAFEEVRDDPLYQHLLAMANVHTAEEFGLDVPGDAYERMAEALRDDSWADIEGQDWFESAQAMAEGEAFFHWELEFPVAFYGESGKRLEDSGFDAVIGNPPYLAGREWGEDLRKARPFFQGRYSCMSDQYDLFALFIQLGVDLTSRQGQFGFITPNTWLNNSHYEALREWLLERIEVQGVGDFRSVNVFPDATVLPIVFTAKLTQTSRSRKFPIDRFASPTENVREWSTTEAWDLFDGTVFSLSVRTNDFEILEKIDDNSHKVSDHCISRFGVKVYQKGKGSPPQSGEEAEQDVFRSAKKEGEDYYPYVRGRDVSAWHVDSGTRWLEYGQHLAEPRSLSTSQ
ncbi:Eco57I restriction-modification methylase domain-containing protein, partial [Halarchaeum acidiphilum]